MKKHYNDIFGYYYTSFEIDKISELAVGRENALEIGAFYGKSTVAIAMNAKRVLSIDPFDCHHSEATKEGNLIRRPDKFNNLPIYLENIKGYDNIRYIVGLSKDIVPTLTETFDYIYIDGDHSYEGVKLDLELCWPLLEKGGILVLHDYDPDNMHGYSLGIKQAFEEKFDSYDGRQDTVIWKVKND